MLMTYPAVNHYDLISGTDLNDLIDPVLNDPDNDPDIALNDLDLALNDLDPLES